MDGRGETLTSQAGVARGADLEVFSEVHFPHSLGLFYGTVTQFLGFKHDSDEWKVMALASYADADNPLTDRLRKLITVHEDGRFELALEYFEFYNFFDKRQYSDGFVDEFGPPRGRDDPITPHHEMLAAAMQQVFEEAVSRIAGALHDRSGLDQVILSGGCFMNSVFNGKVDRLTPFRSAAISSCPDDSGTSIGAALFLHTMRTGQRPPTAGDNYWGPSFSDATCLDTVERYKLGSFEVVDDPSGAAAEDLADGRIVGWFQGRMEFGQRALGNRSILLDPRRPDGRDVVNAAVKFREAFRPFAPAVLAERAADWFECSSDARVPFMERVFMFRPEKRAEVAVGGPRRRLGPAADGGAGRQPEVLRPDRRLRRADRGADGPQHELQPQRRADRVHARRRPPHVHHVRARRPLPGQRPGDEVAGSRWDTRRR